MKKFFQGSHKVMLFSNVFVSLLCTSYLFTGYFNYSVDSDVHHDKTAKVIDNDMEAVSQLGKKSTRVTKVTSVVTKKNVKSSNVKYTPAKYNEVTGSAVVNYAKKYLGLRYVSGGNSLTTGTDCSGFTKLIYKEFGVSLGRTVRSQIKNGSYVKKSDLQKGDLVFYSKGGSTPTHVAIYIGNGKVIHESTPKSGVKISTVNMMTYISARRVINDTANKIAQDKENANKEENKVTNDVNNSANNNSTTNNTTNSTNNNVNNSTTNNTNQNNNTTSGNTTNSTTNNTNSTTNNNNSVTNNNTNTSTNTDASASTNTNTSNNTTTNNESNTSNSNSQNNVYTNGEY